MYILSRSNQQIVVTGAKILVIFLLHFGDSRSNAFIESFSTFWSISSIFLWTFKFMIKHSIGGIAPWNCVNLVTGVKIHIKQSCTGGLALLVATSNYRHITQIICLCAMEAILTYINAVVLAFYTDRHHLSNTHICLKESSPEIFTFQWVTFPHQICSWILIGVCLYIIMSHRNRSSGLFCLEPSYAI